mmetsp:Transcript_19006/g.56543  ORF Transcript_19006/g.56543 Transcript_19006/m.56543 type:complete len:97 (+) Transcript_19006:1595-1885(+)
MVCTSNGVAPAMGLVPTAIVKAGSGLDAVSTIAALGIGLAAESVVDALAFGLVHIPRVSTVFVSKGTPHRSRASGDDLGALEMTIRGGADGVAGSL